MEQDLSIVLFSLIRELNIPVTQQSVKLELQKHPFPSSLLAISDILSFWQIPNAAYKVTLDKVNLLTVPFICHLKNNLFAVVHNVSNEYAVISNEQMRRMKVTREFFNSQFGDFVLIAQKEVTSGEKNYRKKYRTQLLKRWLLPVTVICGAIIFCISWFSFTRYIEAINLSIALLTTIKLLGVFICCLLLSRDLNLNNSILKKICDNSKSANCDSILSSRASKITTYLSWSELGFFYFLGSFLGLIFNTTHDTVLEVLVILNLCALPYTIYSLVYQIRVVKTYCILCMAVQALFWAEFFLFFPYMHFRNTLPRFQEWVNILVCFSTPIILWIFIRSFIIDKQNLQLFKEQLNKLKFNKQVFEYMLHLDPQHGLPSDEACFILGNANSKNVITLVSNPFCTPCKIAHLMLQEWLDHSNDIKVQIVFATSDKREDFRRRVASRLMAIKLDEGNKNAQDALMDWSKFGTVFKDWEKRYNVEESIWNVEIQSRLSDQKKWCEAAGITSTPTVFLNGYRVPNNYQVQDLKYLMH